MSRARPPSHEPPPETLDEADLIIDQTAPPQKSPIRGPLPFGPGHPGRPPSPAASAPQARPLPPPRPAGGPPQPFGDETAAPQRSPLAEALPFRHAKPTAESVSMGPQAAPNPGALRAPEPTMAIPVMTPEALQGLMAGGHDPSASMSRPLGGPGGAPDRAKLERAKLEQARTVAFAMPPEGASPVPAAGGPVAAKSTGHFGLSIEQYAALCAEVAVYPERGEAIFAQYGLAQKKDRMTADLAWQDRLRADGALMARWQSLYLYYHDYYSRARQRGG